MNIKEYLPIEDKYEIIELTLQNSYENGIYNPIKLDIYFNCYIVLSYSDLEFSEEMMNDFGKLYDKILKDGTLEEVIECIPQTEYYDLENYLNETKTAKENYNKGFTRFADILVNSISSTANSIENFDTEKYKEIVKTAKELGMR